MPENRNGNGHDFSPEFLKFWENYPRKVKKIEAWEVWQKVLCAPLLANILSALEWQVCSKDWVAEDGKYVPYPSTYINQRRWTDEPKGSKEKFDMFNYKGE